MKKKFVRPQIQVEVIEDINEPVYMACSGKQWFDLSASGYQHQSYETGRSYAVYQINGKKIGGPRMTNQEVYLYFRFNTPVNIQPSATWKFDSIALDGEGSYIVAVKSTVDVLNETESIGFGDLDIVFENPGVTSGVLEEAWLSLSGPDSCP